MVENEPPKDDEQRSLKDKLGGLGQKIIGEIEEIGGALTGDPMTQAEGQFNVKVGEIREGVTPDSEDEDKQRV